MPMTPHTKSRIKSVGIMTVTILAIASWAGPRAIEASVASVDQRYVKTDSFAAFKQDLSKKFAVDSINSTRDMREVLARLSRLDSGVTDIRRCQHKQSACE